MLGFVALALGAIASPARGDDQPRSYPRGSAAISVILRDDHGGGSETTSAGISAELALGSGRFQYFVDGANSWLQDPHESGLELRGGLGVRWLARAFEIADVGAFEMHLEGLAGVTRLTRELLPREIYPDIGFGLGFQVRIFEPRFAFRLSARAMFAQTHHDEMACQGDCASGVPSFVTLVGFAW